MVVGGVGLLSSSEAEESASSSQESATTGAFFVSFFGLGVGFGVRSDVEMLGRGISLMGLLSLMESWRMEDWSSESGVR